MNQVYAIFDEMGTRFEVEDMKGMTQEMSPDELENIFKSTSYFLLFEQHLDELYKSGKLKELPHGELDFTTVTSALDIMGERIRVDQGDEIYVEWITEAEISWNEKMKG